MAKNMDQSTIKFSPTDYDFLDNASLETWVQEFLSRNTTFVSDFEKMLNMDYSNAYRYHIELRNKYKVIVSFGRIVMQNMPESKLPDLPFFKGFKLPPKLKMPELKTLIHLNMPVDANRIFERSADQKTIMDNNKKMVEFYQKGDFATASQMNHSVGLSNNDVEEIMEQFFGTPDENDDYFCGDSLLISINLNYPKDLIEREIQKILKLHKRRKERTFRFDKWKYYLIMYDLKSNYPHLSYDKFGDALQEAYPKHRRSFDAKNCENYYKNALYLINGGYREYL